MIGRLRLESVIGNLWTGRTISVVVTHMTGDSLEFYDIHPFGVQIMHKN